MGLLDRLFRRRPRPAAPPGPARTPSGPPRRGATPVAAPPVRWVPPGQAVSIAGYGIPDGMVYLGSGLRAPSGITEPALIDPALPIDRRRPDWQGAGLDYWPSFDSIPPASRAAYLAWLADGRRHPHAALGYVFLFFYGLERRVVVDLVGYQDSYARGELPAITREVRRLLSIYGSNRSFRGYATGFLDLVDAVSADSVAAEPPTRTEERWPAPMALRRALAQFAVTRTPVPASWALAWAWFHPQLYPRTPQTRCREEFDRLFRHRYAERHGAGLTIPVAGQPLRFDYRAASAGLRAVAVVPGDLPDVLDRPETRGALSRLVESVTDDLDAYSRWLGRNPDGRGSLAAAALLPPELLDTASGQLHELTAWVEGHLGERDRAVVDGAPLIAWWATAQPGRATKAEAVALLQLLDRLGVGVEPDIRWGGPVLAPGPVVLFRAGADAPRVAAPEYAAATTLLHLAVAVSAADGSVDDAEQEHLVAHVEAALHLGEGEQRRLHAHLAWLVAAGVKLTGLTRRLRALDADQRERIGDVAVATAAADGVISPQEVTTLRKIYTLLGLDPDRVYTLLHAATTPGQQHTAALQEAVTLRPAGPPEPGYRVPERVGVVLDENVVRRRLAESAEVGALLADIFADDEPAGPPPPSAPAGDDAAPVAGLDARHSALLRALGERPAWNRSEYEALAARLDVMSAGALDRINEAAMDLADEPVADGDDDITINPTVLQEMLE